MTDLLNTAVACIGWASCQKSSQSSQFSINQQLKAYITKKTDLAQLLIYLIADNIFKIQQNLRIESEMTILNAIISLGVYLGILVLFEF